jgi:hypothetical protein
MLKRLPCVRKHELPIADAPPERPSGEAHDEVKKEGALGKAEVFQFPLFEEL